MFKQGQIEAIAGEVRAVMGRKQIGLTDLSETVGIPKSTLSNKINGRSGFSAVELVRVAVALDVTITSLVPLDNAATHKAAS